MLRLTENDGSGDAGDRIQIGLKSPAAMGKFEEGEAEDVDMLDSGSKGLQLENIEFKEVMKEAIQEA